MQTKFNLKDYLTFYHEYLIPENYFFDPKNNIDDQYKLLIISSPSRMGNHILHSMIDGHNQIPRVPGEDGVLFHCFKFANESIHEFLHRLKSEDYINQLEEYASTGGKNKKWQAFKYCFDNNIIPKIHSGIQYPTDSFYITDYQDLIFDINYNAYHNFLAQNSKEIQAAECLRDILIIYYNSLNKLDYEFKSKYYDAQIVCSGMRIMSRWSLRCFQKSKLLCSIRPFESYAMSHIMSRYKKEDFSQNILREAWEHWFHKVIDYMMLKIEFPERVVIVNFDDIINQTSSTAKKICNNLNISYDDKMLTPTALGHLTKGNSSSKKDNDKMGKFYKRNNMLPNNLIPQSYWFIWEEISKLFV